MSELVRGVVRCRETLVKMYVANYSMAGKLVAEFNRQSFEIKNRLIAEGKPVSLYPVYFRDASSELDEVATTNLTGDGRTPQVTIRGMGYNARTRQHDRYVSVQTSKKTGLVLSSRVRSIFPYYVQRQLIEEFDPFRILLQTAMVESVSQLRRWNRFFDKERYLFNAYQLEDLLGDPE